MATANLSFHSMFVKTSPSPTPASNITTLPFGQSITAQTSTTSATPSSYNPIYGRGSFFTKSAKEQKVLSKEEMIQEYYAAYDVMTGVRIGATLGGLITLFTLFLVYKSKCRAYREASHKAHEKIRLQLEETQRLENINLANRSKMGSRRYYSPSGAKRGLYMGAVDCSDSASTSPSSDNMPKDIIHMRQTLTDAMNHHHTALRPRPMCLIQTTITSPVSSSAFSDPSTSSASDSHSHKSPASPRNDPDAKATPNVERLTHSDIPAPDSIKKRGQSNSPSLATDSTRSKSQTCSISVETAPPTSAETVGSKTTVSHCNPLLVYQRDSQASTSGESAVLNLRVSTEETSSGEVSLSGGNCPLTVIKCTKPNSEVIKVIVQKEE